MMKAGMMLVAAVAMTGAQPALAQQGAFDEAQLTLHAEMWAMAGVCSQFSRFNVRERALADHLNAVMEHIDADQLDALVAGKDARLEAIAQRSAQLQAMPRGAQREDAVVADAQALMTRCQQLVRSDLAGDYFLSRPS